MGGRSAWSPCPMWVAVFGQSRCSTGLSALDCWGWPPPSVTAWCWHLTRQLLNATSPTASARSSAVAGTPAWMRPPCATAGCSTRPSGCQRCYCSSSPICASCEFWAMSANGCRSTNFGTPSAF
ncbi:hypothetical protein MMMB2_4630 [Mycobacterium marinum MB2]|nr:hypothetical protein MMMB2_4630 [Mycobacterium marinum MB2]